VIACALTVIISKVELAAIGVHHPYWPGVRQTNARAIILPLVSQFRTKVTRLSDFAFVSIVL
jgi:hypothetical protein